MASRRTEAEYIFELERSGAIAALGKGREKSEQADTEPAPSTAPRREGTGKQRRQNEFLHLLSGTIGLRSIDQLEWVPLLEQFIRVRLELDPGLGELATTPDASSRSTHGTGRDDKPSAATENSIAYS